MEPVNTERELTHQEKVENSREIQAREGSKALWAEQRSCTIADEFTRLEVQIATIIFAFASLFADKFTGQVADGFSADGFFLMKIAFAFSIFSLIVSLLFGLIHLKIDENFWSTVLNTRIIRYRYWAQVPQNIKSFEEAEAYHRGTTLEQSHILSSPMWTWVLQTIFLGLGIATLFVLLIVFLFGS